MSLRSTSRHVVPNVSYGTILRIVRNSDMRYEKMLKAPCLTKRHKEARLTYVKDVLLKGPEYWGNILFYDGIRFCIDGPDGCRYYWHHLSKQK